MIQASARSGRASSKPIVAPGMRQGFQSYGGPSE